MARTNGPIQVWHRTDTIPTDAEGGYAGGDSTAAAIAQTVGAATDAVAAANEVALVVGDAGGITTTTTTDRNLNSAAMPDGWRVLSTAVSTFSTGTDPDGDYARSTATAAEAGSGYHGVMTSARPAITPGSVTSAILIAQVRVTGGPTTARLYVQWLQGATSLGVQGNATYQAVDSSWRWISVPVTIPTGTDNYRPTAVADGPWSAGATIDVRRVGIITTPDGAYFDGGTPDTTSPTQDVTHEWDGAPLESTSTRTTVTRTTTGGLGGRTVIQAITDLEDTVAGIDPTDPPPPASVGTPVPAPAGFALRRVDMPQVRRDGTRYTTDTEQVIDDLRPPEGVTYYVSPTGGGDGTTEGAPTTLEAARASSDVGTIIFAPGEYDRTQAHVSGRTPKSINYIAGGPGVRLTGWSQPLAWTNVGGHVYATTRTGTDSVADQRVQYATDGVVNMYAKQAGSTAAAVTGPGQWATDGSTVWAWAHGDTDLAANNTTLRVGLAVDVGVMHSGGTAYVEGITVEGAGAGRGMFMVGGTLLMRDCTVQGAAQNGVTAIDALVLAVRCDASANGMDGFNYHESSGECDFIEVDCTARRNGWRRTGTNNGSTAHETARGVRVGGRYADCHGPLLADVNSSQTWTVGAVTERTDAAILPPSSQQAHYHADGSAATTGTAHMWVQDVDVSGLGMAWRASNGAAVSVRNPRRVATDTVAQIDATSTLNRY